MNCGPQRTQLPYTGEKLGWATHPERDLVGWVPGTRLVAYRTPRDICGCELLGPWSLIRAALVGMRAQKDRACGSLGIVGPISSYRLALLGGAVLLE